MKILTAQQIKLLESATLQTQNIQELDLVRRAGQALFKAITSKLRYHSEFVIFCGTGKNGADGLYCAKLLGDMGHKCWVYVCLLYTSSRYRSANLIIGEELPTKSKSGIFQR